MRLFSGLLAELVVLILTFFDLHSDVSGVLVWSTLVEDEKRVFILSYVCDFLSLVFGIEPTFVTISGVHRS